VGYVLTATLGMLLGFLSGLLSFKVKSGWCPDCGMIKSCPGCAGWVDPRTTHERPGATTADSRPGRARAVRCQLDRGTG
jgi:hypothetical protein